MISQTFSLKGTSAIHVQDLPSADQPSLDKMVYQTATGACNGSRVGDENDLWDSKKARVLVQAKSLHS